MDAEDNQLIVVNPRILAGKPVVCGTRIPVSLILNLIAHGYDFDRIVEAYPALTTEAIRAAITYSERRMDREEVRVLGHPA
jgi:uncharacterized protein (DUF433 family)